MDMDALMAQAQELQAKVAAAQEKLASMHVKGIAENGACIVDMTAKYDIMSVTLRPEILSSGADVVGKIVADAYRDAKQKADAIIDNVMGEATAGMPLPE